MAPPITKLTNLSFATNQTQFNGLYVPSCTAEQIAAIPRNVLSPGGLIFDTTAEELLTYSAAGFWLPVLTSQSDIPVDFTNIACETLNADEITTDSLTTGDLTAGDITSDTITTEHVFTGTNGTVATGNINTNTINVSDLITTERFRVRDCISGMIPSTNVSPITRILDVGAGTGATSNMFGSVMSGRFTLTTGSSPTASAVICTFTLPADIAAYANGVFGAVFYPGSPQTVEAQTYATTASPQRQILFGVYNGLQPFTQYIWNYIILTNQIVS